MLDEAVLTKVKTHLNKIIQKVNAFDTQQPSSSVNEIITALDQQIKRSETASGLSYTDPNFMAFVSQTELAEAAAKIEAEKAAKEQQKQWA